MSSLALGSHLCYGSLKTVAGQVEQLVQRVTDGADVKLDADGEECSADATTA